MKRDKKIKKLVLMAVIFLGLIIPAAPIVASDRDKEQNFRSTNFPMPRFASLAKGKTNVRAGPGQKYPVKWVYVRAGLPVEIILEYENWRKIKDHEGQEGWVYHTLLSGKRTAIILGENPVPAYRKMPSDKDVKQRVSIYLDPLVVVKIDECNGAWCGVFASGFFGWTQRKSLWGVYEDENID